MSYSQTSTIASEISSDAPLSDETLAYLEERAKNAFYDYVLGKFKEAHISCGLTKAELARRLNMRPDHISHVLGAPGNWTIGTATALLVGISREEVVPYSRNLLDGAPRNLQPDDLLEEAQGKWDDAPSGSALTSTPAPPADAAHWMQG